MNQTQVSCTGGRFFTSWATREAEEYWSGWPFPLQGIFLTQGLNPGFLDCRQILYCCSHQGSSKYNGSAMTLWPHGLYSPWNSPGQNIGMGSLSLLQGIFPTQGSNPGLCIAGGFFTSGVTREAKEYWSGQPIHSPAVLPTKEDPVDVGNLISSSSAFSKPSLHIWKFSVHVQLKPSKKELDHYLASMWNEHNFKVIWIFFGLDLLWIWHESLPFPVLWLLLTFPNLLAYWVQHSKSIIF